MTRKRKTEDARVARLDYRKIEHMVAVLIRNQKAYEQCERSLTPEYVRTAGVHLGVVWGVVKDYCTQFGALPHLADLRAEIHQALSADPHGLEAEELQELDDFLVFCFDDAAHGIDLSADEQVAVSAAHTCHRFIQECIAQSMIHNLDPVQGDLPVDISAKLKEAAAQIDSAGELVTDAITPLFAPGWDDGERPELRSIGVPALDRFTGGGLSYDEVLLFMGPIGSMKSTVATHGCIQMAKQEAAIETPHDDRTPVTVMVSAEELHDAFRFRVLSYLAQIPRNRLMRLKSLDALCREPHWIGAIAGTEYEHKLYDQCEESYVCEYDRAMAAMEFVDRHVVFVPFFPTAKNAGMGTGGIPELATLLKNYFHRHPDKRPVSVWIDHFSAISRRLVTANGMSEFDRLRHHLVEFPDQCSKLIAAQLRAPVIAFHQLSGVANARRSTAHMHHTDAAECKMIGEFTNFCVQTTMPTPDDRQLAVWRCTKHRREPPVEYAIVKVNGAFSSVSDCSKDYVLTADQRDIVLRSEKEATVQAHKMRTKSANRSLMPAYREVTG